MLLEATHLAKRYGALQAVSDVSLTVGVGEIVGFLGPNGAGKSTTMQMVAGAMQPDAGSITIAGSNALADPMAIRRQVGFLPQRPPLYPDMRVAAHLTHVARLRGIQRGERRRRVVEAMELADISNLERRFCGKLSGGQRQRVGLAAALLDRPPLVILDEPTAGLDPTQVANLRDALARLRERHGILLSTHVLGEVTASCDRVIVIHQGHTRFQAPIAELEAMAARSDRIRLRLERQAAPADATALASLASVHHVELSHDHLLVDSDPTQRAEIIAWATKHGGLRELAEVQRSLEEVFTDLLQQPAAHPSG